jgi:hypothetical protein
VDEREAHSWVWSAARTYYNSRHSNRGRTIRDAAGRASRHAAAYPAKCLVYGGGGGGDDITTPATNSDISVYDAFSAWDLPREGHQYLTP